MQEKLREKHKDQLYIKKSCGNKKVSGVAVNFLWLSIFASFCFLL